ncbi:probable 2-oxoglutarate-dependent dioxygenase AOP1 [Solanum lycopersicum]|uniref:Fe2OG dioxygenase domain-containing protein n=1 Tax=Solanum lycopersicum TaxID=4081 RepID=A0A3Q7E800_SOLLC|nr:probable 2-oxoglutarate-dependent dioxygenase AOP1 [Solanum lycopersicum]BDF88547.1 tomatine 20-hydroxylase [Solanum lycopersicum]
MASTKVKIPTIDFSNEELKPNTPLWESTKIQLFEALQEYGCIEAILYDKNLNEIREGLFDFSKKLFEFPLETKMKNISEVQYHIGYIGQIPHLPSYESLGIPDFLAPQSVENFANIFWPHGNHEFCNLVKSYASSLLKLDQIIKRMILENLGLEKHINELLDNFALFRFSHYKGSLSINKDENDKYDGLSAHTDNNFLTFIAQNQVNGLQINKNGEWINATISPNSFVVLSGDSFKAWTNGRLHSPLHRVEMPKEGDRLSLQFNTLSKPGHFIEAPKELVDEKHPLLFKPYEMLGLLNYVASNAGTPNAFQAYCGV